MNHYLIEGRVTRADRATSPFLYLPFEVAAGTSSIEVSYRYDPGNVIDIGIFDPRITDFPSRQGFRGWSGGARASFFVARDGATPGYIAGDLPVGTWRVILGLYRIAKQGCRYRVEIDLTTQKRNVIAPVKRISTVRQEAGWYRGDLHSHTHHSDARGSLGDLVTAAKSRGLDFLAVTDHNTISHHRYLADESSSELLLIPGQEVTTYRGHANVWGSDGWIDFRITRAEQLDRLVTEVHDRGGLFSVNHPKGTGSDWRYPFPEDLDCFEVWQAPWSYRNWEALERYDALLKQGKRVTLVGGSDRHQPGWPELDPEALMIGSPTTWLYLAELSVEAVLEGLRKGKAFVSESPDGPRLQIFIDDTPMGDYLPSATSSPKSARAIVHGASGDLLRWLAEDGPVREVPITSDAFEDCWSWTPQGYFLRAEVLARGNKEQLIAAAGELEHMGKFPKQLSFEEVVSHDFIRALSNPIYLRRGR